MYMIVYSPQQERKNKIIQYIYIRPLLSILNYASKIQSDSQGEGGGGGMYLSYLNISCELGYLGTVGG